MSYKIVLLQQLVRWYNISVFSVCESQSIKFLQPYNLDMLTMLLDAFM